MSRWFLFRVFVVTGFTLVFLSIFRVGIVTEKNVTIMHASHETRHGIDRFRSYDLYLSSCCFVMAPFEPPESVLTGFKERIEALSLQGISIQPVTLAQLIV